VHHVVEVVSYLDGSIAAQIAVGFGVCHLVLIGKAAMSSMIYSDMSLMLNINCHQ
jgi:hypothetical protein